jgi:hypothetical protein
MYAVPSVALMPVPVNPDARSPADLQAVVAVTAAEGADPAAVQ